MVAAAVAAVLEQPILQQLWPSSSRGVPIQQQLKAGPAAAEAAMQMESGPVMLVNQAVNARQITIAMF